MVWKFVSFVVWSLSALAVLCLCAAADDDGPRGA